MTLLREDLTEKEMFDIIKSQYFKENTIKYIDEFLLYYEMPPTVLHELLKHSSDYQKNRITDHPSYKMTAKMIIMHIGEKSENK